MLDILLHGSLTKSQYGITQHLIQNPWKIYSRESLKQFLSSEYVDDRTIDTHIKRLRKKLEWIQVWLSEKIISISWAWYYFELWEFDINLFEEKIEIDEWIFFIPQIQALYKEEKWIINLTKSEYETFRYLIQNPKRIFSKEYLLDILEGHWRVENKDIPRYINRIRKKLNIIQEWLWERIKKHYWEWFSWE
jgi:DNA-binding response OmpR family regulator